MPQIDPVILELRARLDNYERNLADAVRMADDRLEKIEKRGDKMEKGLGRSFRNAGASLLAFAGTMGAAGLSREFLRIADSAKMLDAQLRLATKETGSFAVATADVRRIAGETRTSLEDTAKLYGNFQRNARELGISQEEAARATETVSKTFKISGASAVEASQGTRQLVQALQSGVLRGDEFNTIMESSPRLARLLADSLGLPVGQLRKMAEAGLLTSATLTRAFTDTKFTADIDEEFRQMPVTFDEAMQSIENAAVITFGAFDRGGQFSTALANFVTDGSTGFADLERAAESFGQTIASEFAGIGAIFNNAITELARLKAVIDSLGGAGMADRIGESISNTTSLLFNPLGTAISLSPAYQGAKADSIAASNSRLGRTPGSALARFHEDIRARYMPTGNPLARPSGAAASKKTGRKGPSAETLEKRAQREAEAAMRDEYQRTDKLAQIEDDILSAKLALATSAITITAFELQQNENEKQRRLARINLEEQLGDLTAEDAAAMRESIETLADLNDQRAMRASDERMAAIELAQMRDASDTMKAEAELIRSREARVEVERDILDLAYKEEEAAIRRAHANGEIADLDIALANMRRRQLAQQQGLERANLSPGKQFLSDLTDEAENLGDAYEDVAVRGLERMGNAFTEAARKGLGLHGVLGNIIGDFIEIAIRQQLLGPLASAIFGGGNLFGLLGGGLGNSINSQAMTNIMAINGARATGGPVSAGGTYLVGERGPELLRMGGNSGFVVPNHLLGSASGRVVQNVTIKVDAQGALLAGQVEAMVRSGMVQAAQIGTMAGAADGERRVMDRSRRRIPG